MKPPSKIGATAGRKLFTSDSASSSGSSSSDSSDFSSSTTSAKGTGAPSGALVVKRRASRSRSLKTPKLPEPPKTHEDFVHLTQVSSTAVIPTDYPILVAPAEDMRRLMGVPRRRRFTALEARRQMRNELGRLRASVSQMWFLCLLVLAALSVPAGLVIAPFISFGDFQSTTAGHPGGWTLPFTGDPLANLSRDCLRPLKLSDDIKQLNMHNITVHAVPAHKGDLICVFNNSRFRKAQRYDYVPVIMPLSLCNSLLYWSVAVVDGVVRNRVPEFDVHYGVYRMPQLVGRLATGGSLPPLLIGVGGHRQDSAHLSRLGRDPIVHSKFGASLLRFSDKHGIGGAVIDWKDITGACGYTDDIVYLARAIAAIRKLTALNSENYAIGVIVQAETRIAQAITRAVTPLNTAFIIYETHRIHLDDVLKMCASAQTNAVTLLADMERVAAAAVVGTPFKVPRLCASFTAGVPVSRAYEGTPPIIVPDSVAMGNISLTPGIVAVYEFCALTAVSQVSIYPNHGDCISITKRPVGQTAEKVTLPGGTTVAAGTAIDDYYAFVSSATVRAEYLATAAVDSLRCAAVYDLDFDLYRGGCVNVQPHFGILNIENGLR